MDSGPAGFGSTHPRFSIRPSPNFTPHPSGYDPVSLKRRFTETENLQQLTLQRQQLQMQIQNAILLRSVKQRQMPSPVSTLSPLTSSLQDLERRLLFDEEDQHNSNDRNSNNNSNNLMSQSNSNNVLSPSPTNSSTSTNSSTAAPDSSSTSSRQLLLETAVALADGDAPAVEAKLSALKPLANPRGDPEQRLTAMMLAPLISRMNATSSSASSFSNSGLCSQEHFVSTQLLYNFSPCFKLALIAAGYAILDATKDHSKIHILDFEVSQGCLYAALLKALAERRSASPPSLKITAVVDPSSPFTNTNAVNLRSVADRIERLGASHGLAVRFNVVSVKPAEMNPGSLGLEPGEAVAVNLPFVLSRVADESVSPANPRDQLLRTVRGLGPIVVVLVEQEMNMNTARFASRFAEACGYYGALLESLDGSFDREPERIGVEAGLARRVVNSVAREGADRVERCEVFGKWRARMGMAGLRSIPVGAGVVEPVRGRFEAAVQKNRGLIMKEGFGGVGIGFGWRDRVLTVASAWR